MAGTIFVAVDDLAEVVVNGIVIGSTGSVTDFGEAASAQASLKEFDLLAFLEPGPNNITIRAQNGPSSFAGGCNPCNYSQNPAGVVFGGSISCSGATAVHAATWGRIKTTYR
jgi:hypothetical protein